MDFDDAVKAAIKKPKKCYLGILYHISGPFFGAYWLTAAGKGKEEPKVTIRYEGGILFHQVGQMDTFTPETLPEAARIISYLPVEEFPDIGSMMPEDALKLVFDELPDPATCRTAAQREDFAKCADKVFREWFSKQ